MSINTETPEPNDVYNLACRWYQAELAGWDYLPEEWKTANSGLTLLEYISQCLDGSHAVIMILEAGLVLLASNYDVSEAEDEGLGNLDVSGRAYYALMADVTERLSMQGWNLEAQEPEDLAEDEDEDEDDEEAGSARLTTAADLLAAVRGLRPDAADLIELEDVRDLATGLYIEISVADLGRIADEAAAAVSDKES